MMKNLNALKNSLLLEYEENVCVTVLLLSETWLH
jgi:hypothetical protein